MEKSLWSKAVADGFKKNAAGKIVPVKVAPQNTKEAFLEIAHSLTPEDLSGGFKSMSSALQRFGMDSKALATYRQGMQTQEFLDTGRVPAAILAKIKIKEVPAYDLISFRSSLLDAARKAEAGGEAGAAQKFSRLSASVLDDLSTMPGVAYDNARAFSKKLNDIYTRTFAGELSTISRTGAERFPPEILVNKAFNRAGDVSDLRMKEIDEAVGFMGTQYDDAVSKFGVNSAEASALLPYKELSTRQFSSVRDAQSNVLKLEVAAMADPATGLIKPANLDKYIAKNADLINRLGLKDEFSSLSKAQHTYLSVADTQSALNKSLKDEKAFASLLKNVDDPARAISDVLGSDNPVTAMRNMAKLAKEADPAIREQAKKGLVSMVLQNAFEKAVDKNGNFNVQVYEDALFAPIRSNQPSVGNLLYSNGLVSLTQAKNLKRLLDPMRRISVAAKESGQLEDVLPGGAVNAVEGLAVSQLGLRVASYTKPGGPGSLGWASRVARATENFFNKTPARQAMKLLEEAALDSDLTAALLRVGKTDAERKALNLTFLSRMFSPGVTSSVTFRELMNEDDRTLARLPKDAPAQVPEEAPRNQAKGLLQRLPTVQTRGTIVPQRAAMPAPGGASGPPAPVGQGTSSRKMLQSLFPRDDISAME
jgi:hypothetical protein